MIRFHSGSKRSCSHTKVVALLLLAAVILCGIGCSSSSNSSSGGPIAGSDTATTKVGMLRDTSGGQFVLPWESTFGGTLGDGFNSVNETVIQSPCIDYTTVSQGSVTTSGDFQVYDSYEDLASSMNVNYSTSSNYGIYKNSVQANVMANMSMSSNTIYAYAYYRVWGPSISTQNVKLLDKYVNYTPEQIVNACGNYYIGNISQGGMLEVIVSITTKNMAEKATVQYDFSQKVAKTKTDVNAQADLSKFLSERNASIKVIARGCTALAPPSSADLSYFYSSQAQFYNDVSQCLKNPQNINLADNITFYTLDHLVPGVADVLSMKQQAVDASLVADLEYRKILVDIDDILNNSDFYIWDSSHYSKADLQTTVKSQINSYLAEISSSLNVCSTAPLNCSFPADISDSNGNTYQKIRAKLPVHGTFYPKNCDEIYRNNKSTENGSHTIYLGGNQNRPLDVYCTFGAGGSLDYLDLPGYNDISNPDDSNFYTPGDNYSEIVDEWNYSPHKDYPDQVTSWQRVRIDPGESTVTIILNDYTFAKTYTSPSNPTVIPDPPGHYASYYHFPPFGYAIGGWTANSTTIPNPYVYRDLPGGADAWCKKTSVAGTDDSVTNQGCGWGKAQVSVVGTPLAISDNTQWIAQGYESRGWTEFSNNRQTVKIYGTGNYGGMIPYIIVGNSPALGIELDYVGK